MRTYSISSFKITTRNRKLICKIFKYIHCLDTKFISYYLVSEVETLHIYHKPYCMEANGYDGKFHCATRCTKCGIAFVVSVRSKVRNIDIHSIRLVLMFFQNMTKNMHKMIVLLVPRVKWKSPFFKVEYSNIYFKIASTGNI